MNGRTDLDASWAFDTHRTGAKSGYTGTSDTITRRIVSRQETPGTQLVVFSDCCSQRSYTVRACGGALERCHNQRVSGPERDVPIRFSGVRGSSLAQVRGKMDLFGVLVLGVQADCRWLRSDRTMST